MQHHHPEIQDVLYSSEQLAVRVEELARNIVEDLAGEAPYLVSLLNGGTVFAVDLMRAMDVDLTIRFVRACSYGDATRPGAVQYQLDGLGKDSLRGRRVLLVDDIADTGNTLKGLIDYFTQEGAADVRTAVMLDKPSRRACDLMPDYVGFTVPDVFIVGYGMDYAGAFRYLRDICTLKPEVYGRLGKG